MLLIERHELCSIVHAAKIIKILDTANLSEAYYFQQREIMVNFIFVRDIFIATITPLIIMQSLITDIIINPH